MTVPTERYPWWKPYCAHGLGMSYTYTCEQLDRIAQRKVIALPNDNICISAPWWVLAAALVRKWRGM